MLREHESDVELEESQANVQYTALHEIDLKTPSVDTESNILSEQPEPVNATISTRIHDSFVYAGGKISYYVAGPAMVYALYPAAQFVAEPIAVASTSAIAALPVSWPVLGAMALAAGVIVPRVMPAPAATIQSGTQAAGETVTAKVLSGSKTAVTYAYDASTNAINSLWGKPKPKSDYLPIDEEYEDLALELLTSSVNKPSSLV